MSVLLYARSRETKRKKKRKNKPYLRVVLATLCILLWFYRCSIGCANNRFSAAATFTKGFYNNKETFQLSLRRRRPADTANVYKLVYYIYIRRSSHRIAKTLIAISVSMFSCAREPHKHVCFYSTNFSSERWAVRDLHTNGDESFVSVYGIAAVATCREIWLTTRLTWLLQFIRTLSLSAPQFFRSLDTRVIFAKDTF